MKKQISFLLVTVMLLVLMGCGNVEQPNNSPASTNQSDVIPTITENDTSTQSESSSNNQPEIVKASLGDRFDTEDFIISFVTAFIYEDENNFWTYEADNGSGFKTGFTIDRGKRALILRGTFKNLGAEEINRFCIQGEVEINSKYKYRCEMVSNEHSGNFSPLMDTEFYFYAQIPEGIINDLKSLTFNMAFPKDFAIWYTYEYYPEEYRTVYRVDATI